LVAQRATSPHQQTCKSTQSAVFGFGTKTQETTKESQDSEGKSQKEQGAVT